MIGIGLNRQSIQSRCLCSFWLQQMGCATSSSRIGQAQGQPHREVTQVIDLKQHNAAVRPSTSQKIFTPTNVQRIEVKPLHSNSTAPILSDGRISYRDIRSASLHSLAGSVTSPRRGVSSASRSMASSGDMHFEVVERGSLYGLDYRLYFKGPNGFISPWHDIPLYANEANNTFNMIVEIPRWTNAKMEMATAEPLNPIKQDEKKGLPRFVHNIFPYKGYIWNYGALPQTWEDPNHVVPETGAKGDNDPIDVIEIGSKVHKRGAVVQVKILGTVALIDEGETDWKLVAIDVNDPVAAQLNDIEDVNKHFPGLLSASVEWFRVYKIPAGKPANQFGFDGNFKDKEFALRVILETHEYWKKLVKEPSPKLNTTSQVPDAAHHLTADFGKEVISKSAEPGPVKPLPDDVDTWHFVSATAKL
ncbi:hypothetical protein WR25_06585 [Diploscapter pachys]|uniref:inorganic diphosphatase n=1 Tax=Diploscapter pachys TaxID=2018661 RepID=A0A2A2L0I7_9BILA|nr:hypothetical protein WR25_06585 [Diploscapter pachys]